MIRRDWNSGQKLAWAEAVSQWQNLSCFVRPLSYTSSILTKHGWKLPHIRVLTSWFFARYLNVSSTSAGSPGRGDWNGEEEFVDSFHHQFQGQSYEREEMFKDNCVRYSSPDIPFIRDDGSLRKRNGENLRIVEQTIPCLCHGKTTMDMQGRLSDCQPPRICEAVYC